MVVRARECREGFLQRSVAAGVSRITRNQTTAMVRSASQFLVSYGIYYSVVNRSRRHLISVQMQTAKACAPSAVIVADFQYEH